jgi:hypothetical protein
MTDQAIIKELISGLYAKKGYQEVHYESMAESS